MSLISPCFKLFIVARHFNKWYFSITNRALLVHIWLSQSSICAICDLCTEIVLAPFCGIPSQQNFVWNPMQSSGNVGYKVDAVQNLEMLLSSHRPFKLTFRLFLWAFFSLGSLSEPPFLNIVFYLIYFLFLRYAADHCQQGNKNGRKLLRSNWSVRTQEKVCCNCLLKQYYTEGVFLHVRYYDISKCHRLCSIVHV